MTAGKKVIWNILDSFSGLNLYPEKGSSSPVTPTRWPRPYQVSLPEAIAALLPAVLAGRALLHDNARGVLARARTLGTGARVCCGRTVSRAEGCKRPLLAHRERLRPLLRAPADAPSQQLSCSFLGFCLFPQDILVSWYHFNRCKFTFQLLRVYLRFTLAPLPLPAWSRHQETRLFLV